jgi:arylformamidase
MSNRNEPSSMRDAAWYERELNPRVTVSDVAGIIASWKARAEATRARRAFRADIAYGPHPRERLDFYPADNPKGTFIFIHGGYWRIFSQFETSWIADGFVDQGYSVALPTYPLCPEVTLADIVASIRRAFAHLWLTELSDGERGRVVVGGHSAGGHLTAVLLATDWTAYGLPAEPFAGAVPISGVFDLPPLLHTTINEQVRLTEDSARALSPVNWTPKCLVRTVLAVGARESDEFHRQSKALLAAWPQMPARLLDVDDANHFTVIDGLAVPGSVLNRAVIELLQEAGS